MKITTLIVSFLCLFLTGCNVLPNALAKQQRMPVIATVGTADEAYTQAKAYAATVPGAGVSFYLNTGSMLKTFDSDTVVVVEPIKFNDIRGGDLLAFTTDGGDSMLHWVINWDNGGPQTYGDTKYIMDRIPSYGSDYTARPFGASALYMPHSGLQPRNIHGVVKRAWKVSNPVRFN